MAVPYDAIVPVAHAGALTRNKRMFAVSALFAVAISCVALLSLGKCTVSHVGSSLHISLSDKLVPNEMT
jgi:hypothetical protein